MRPALLRAALWWCVIGIWVYVLAFALPASAQGVRDTGSLVSSATVLADEVAPVVPSGASWVCVSGWVFEGPPGVPFAAPWSCFEAAPGASVVNTGCCRWVNWSGTDYWTRYESFAVEFWSDQAAPPPDPPASSPSSAAAGCGGDDCLTEGTFEGWARIVAAFLVVVVWSLGLAHGRGAS